MITSKWFLGGEDISLPLSIRHQVFVEEQGFSPEEEEDVYDAQAMHVVMYDDDQPVSTGRLYFDGKVFWIGRICTIPAYRGQHVSDLMVRLLIWKGFHYTNTLYVHSQVRTQGYYARYGFVAYEEDEEQGVPHVKMKVDKENLVFPSECGENNAPKVLES